MLAYVVELQLSHDFVAPGYYWIDPNLGGTHDAISVFCKKPGCSCLDCDAPAVRQPKTWSKRNTAFTELEDGYEVMAACGLDVVYLALSLTT